MVLLAEVALIRITTDKKIPLVELLIEVTEQEQLKRKLQDQLTKKDQLIRKLQDQLASRR